MKYYGELIDAMSNEDFYATEEVLEKITEDDDSIEYVGAILKFMEGNPYVDYGMPGPIVHYIERYYLRGYEQLLFESLTRNPIQHTLWMLNRILNSPKLEDKEKYLALLRSIELDDSVDDVVRNDARNFLDYQDGK